MLHFKFEDRARCEHDCVFFKLTRPEWIVLICLTQQPRLNAMQISTVTGRAKTSIAGAVKQLQKKKLITRKTDVDDSRRQVLHLTPAGQETYKAIIGSFVDREVDVLACLAPSERRTLVRLFDKIIENSRSWALPYQAACLLAATSPACAVTSA